jgi:hypothetical protein
VKVLAAITAAAISFAAAAQTPFSFAAFGDAPYFEFEAPAVRRLFDEMAQHGVAFAVHVGDLKSGTTPCSDEMLLRRRALLDAAPVPLVFVPGDNEWSDCYRESAGAHQPRERLDRLRALFFGSNESLGQRRMRFAQQSDDSRFRSFRENVRWVAGQIVFVTLNMPGSNNNLGRNKSMDAEHAERMAANLAWLAAAVKLAREPPMRGIVIFAHADPGFGRKPRRIDGYAGLRNALRAHAATFRKPMLFVHGDGHRYRVDEPLRDPQTDRPLDHFTRVEVFGSPTVNWVRIEIAPEGERLFNITPGEH